MKLWGNLVNGIMPLRFFEEKSVLDVMRFWIKFLKFEKKYVL